MKHKLSYLYPFFAIVLWSGNVIVSRLSARTIGPEAMTFYRLLFAVLLMSSFVAISAWRNRSVIWRYLGQFAILGFLAMCLFQCLSYLAAESTSATNMAIFTALTPLLTVCISTVLLRETPAIGVVLGGILSLSGLIFLVSAGNPMTIVRQGIHLGDLLMLVAALIYALYGVLLRRWRLPVTGWQSTYLQAFCALIIMFPALLATPASLRVLNAQTIPLIIYAGGLASVMLPWLWLRGIQHLGPNRCAAFMNLLPVLTSLEAVLWLGESLRISDVVGGSIVLLGVACTSIFRRPLYSSQAPSVSIRQQAIGKFDDTGPMIELPANESDKFHRLA